MGKNKKKYNIISICCGKVDIEYTDNLDDAKDIVDDIEQHFGSAIILTNLQYEKLKEKLNLKP